MNKINQRTESNAKLLSILARRNEHQFVRHSENQWPGKKRPSFAFSMNTKRSEPSPRIGQRTQRKSEFLPCTVVKPSEIVTSSKSLSLIPKYDKRPLQKSKNLTGSSLNLKSYSYRSKESTVEPLSKRSNPDEMEGYVIDFMAFNYLGKVIDNPELWKKFVHKKLGN